LDYNESVGKIPLVQRCFFPLGSPKGFVKVHQVFWETTPLEGSENRSTVGLEHVGSKPLGPLKSPNLWNAVGLKKTFLALFSWEKRECQIPQYPLPRLKGVTKNA